MRLSFDAIHIVGYVGALGSLLFGGNQLRVILQHHSAKDVGVFDYGLRVAYSALLGIYAIGTGDMVFMVVNFGAALLSLAVAIAASTMKKEHGQGGTNQAKVGRRLSPLPGARRRWGARPSWSRRTAR